MSCNPELSSLSVPYLVAITELEVEIGFLRSELIETGDMVSSEYAWGSDWHIRKNAFAPGVQRRLEHILKIVGETSRIRLEETIQHKRSFYNSITRPGMICKMDGSIVMKGGSADEVT